MSPARHKPATAEATYLWRIQYFRSAKGGTVFAPTAAFLKFSACVFSREARKVLQSILIKQTTIAAPAETSGLGLHTAVPVRVRLRPAPPDNGLVFVRTDLDDFEINASVECIAHCSYATTLMRTGVMLSTVEHLLAALRGLGVDNAYIEVDNLELPIMDGSADDFAAMILRAGVVEQPAARRALRVRRRVQIEQGDRRMSVEPHETWEIDCMIDFPHPLIGMQRLRFDALDPEAFLREIAPARTFGFTEEIEVLRRANLIRGGSLENAIVLTPAGMLNETPLRRADEFVRHKILDIIGDLALLGMPLLGLVRAERSGHLLHAALMSKLLRDDAAWEIVDMPVGAHLAVAS
ncbi:MAG: UDP-3-O-[3-hydroxymyristoyl] N-acetylglucosamine deacetylase [Acidobacteria bacterium]|nr:MAG: UDP-3-O-[3-hydroxymyristoyl] N-acetylglucosamine deacetylase [Acidobacteriota bacterium]PYS80796.1 MAG: UDP-3-O-[3-hydroxymyristoyl] N-acetylglucosamine deacetylase [Acidobacteriota bacterium]